MNNTIILPAHLFQPEMTVQWDSKCPDANAYLIDADGRVHCFSYMGRIPRPGDPGYVPAECPTCDGSGLVVVTNQATGEPEHDTCLDCTPWV